MIRPPVAGLEWVEDLEIVMMAGEQGYREVVNDGTWVRRTRLRGCGNVFPAVVVRDRCVGRVAMSRCTFPFSTSCTLCSFRQCNGLSQGLHLSSFV